MNQTNKMYFYSKQKRRAISMFVANRKIYKVNRNRKREYTPYEISKEEVKKYQQKRSKSMNIKRGYDKDGRWEENDKEDFEEEFRRIEKTMNDNDGDKMNRERT